MKAIIPGLYSFENLLVGRVYLLDDGDGLRIVDTGLALAADRVLDQLAASGRRAADVREIWVTHAHPDHVGGLRKLRDVTGAQVIASAVEKPIIEGVAPVPRPDPASLPLPARLMPIPETRYEGVSVDRSVEAGEILAGGWTVVATPGHAPGHISFWHPVKRALLLGDVLMNVVGLRLPIASATFDMEQNKRSLRRLLDLDVQTLCFGHGQPIMQDGGEVLRAFAKRTNIL